MSPVKYTLLVAIFIQICRGQFRNTKGILPKNLSQEFNSGKVKDISSSVLAPVGRKLRSLTGDLGKQRKFANFKTNDNISNANPVSSANIMYNGNYAKVAYCKGSNNSAFTNADVNVVNTPARSKTLTSNLVNSILNGNTGLLKRNSSAKLESSLGMLNRNIDQKAKFTKYGNNDNVNNVSASVGSKSNKSNNIHGLNVRPNNLEKASLVAVKSRIPQGGNKWKSVYRS